VEFGPTHIFTQIYAPGCASVCWRWRRCWRCYYVLLWREVPPGDWNKKKNRKYFKAQLYGTYEVLLFHVHSILISWRLWHHTLICGYVAHYSCWRFHGPCSRSVNTGVQKFFFARSARKLLPSTFKVVVGLSCRLTKLNVCLASPLCWRDRRTDGQTDRHESDAIRLLLDAATVIIHRVPTEGDTKSWRWLR